MNLFLSKSLEFNTLLARRGKRHHHHKQTNKPTSFAIKKISESEEKTLLLNPQTTCICQSRPPLMRHFKDTSFKLYEKHTLV